MLQFARGCDGPLAVGDRAAVVVDWYRRGAETSALIDTAMSSTLYAVACSVRYLRDELCGCSRNATNGDAATAAFGASDRAAPLLDTHLELETGVRRGRQDEYN